MRENKTEKKLEAKKESVLSQSKLVKQKTVAYPIQDLLGQSIHQFPLELSL